MTSEENRAPFGPRRRYDHAPAPVKVAVSLVYVEMGLLLLGALALNLWLARTPGGQTSRWPWTAVVLGIAVGYGVLAYRLLQATEWARIATIALTATGVVLAVAFFQAWFCMAIPFGIIQIVALLVPESREFFAGRWPPED